MKTVPKNIVSLDFETFWSDEVSVKKLTTVDYVRHPEMKVLSVALKRDGQRTPTFHAGDEIRPALEAIDWGSTAMLAHHAHFDGLFLSEFYGIVPAFYLDTLSMGRALHRAEVGGSLSALSELYGLGAKTEGGAILLETKGLRNVEDLSYAQRRRFVKYNKQDVNLLWRLWRAMRGAFVPEELALIDLTVRMQCDPRLEIDAEGVRRELARERAEKRAAVELGCVAAGAFLPRVSQATMGIDEEGRNTEEFRKVLGSSAKLYDLLCAMSGKENVPVKRSPTDPDKRIPAFAKTDLGMQKLHREGSPDVKKVLDARLLLKSTIGETRCLRLLSHSSEGTKKIPVYLQYCGAHTGRWTGGDSANFQNIPVRKSSAIRECVRAPRDHVLVVVDSSQIEARALAWLAGQTSMLDVFRSGQDPYRYMAANMYDKPMQDITPDERFVGKTVVLGAGFGLGWKRYRDSMAEGQLGPPVILTPKEAGRIIKAFRSSNQWYSWFWVQMQRRLEMMFASVDPPNYWARDDDLCPLGMDGPGKPVLRFFKDEIVLPNDLSMHYPDIEGKMTETEYEDEDGEIKKFQSMEYSYRTNNRGERGKIHGRLITENIIQALARIVVGEQMLRVADYWPVAMMTHDEVVAVVPKKEAPRALGYMEEMFRTPPDWCPGLPVAGEGAWSREYRKP